MADPGSLPAVLAEIRRDVKDAHGRGAPRRLADKIAPRLLAAVDAVLALHSRQETPVRSWNHVCPAHRDARGFADPRQMAMADCPDCRFTEIWVCRHCSCPNDGWPCPTYAAIERELTGKGETGEPE